MGQGEQITNPAPPPWAGSSRPPIPSMGDGSVRPPCRTPSASGPRVVAHSPQRVHSRGNPGVGLRNRRSCRTLHVASLIRPHPPSAGEPSLSLLSQAPEKAPAAKYPTRQGHPVAGRRRAKGGLPSRTPISPSTGDTRRVDKPARSIAASPFGEEPSDTERAVSSSFCAHAPQCTPQTLRLKIEN